MQMQVITNKIGGGRFMENLEWVKFNDLEKKKARKVRLICMKIQIIPI
jgi:hypothetical protein